jgi:hypothetical protein
MASGAPVEVVSLGDGTEISLARVPGVDDATWGEVKTYLQGNPDMAKRLKGFSKNPDALRGWLQTQAIAEHYHSEPEGADAAVQDRIRSLEQDAELAPVLEDIKKNGIESAMKFYQDEELMLKFSRKMGGVPTEISAKLQKIDETALNLHEAARNGDLQRVQEFLERRQPLDAQDHKGVTALGYAIGANRIAVVKMLLDSRANPFAVDASGNSGLHYAAGYGRKELVEYLLKVGASIGQTNAQGQKPMDVANINRQEDVVALLRAHGAQ